MISIGGPTASGKTNLAFRLAVKLGTDIISFDSRQIYKELNIGVAKPDPEVLSTVQHHFINHVSIQQSFNAAQFEKQALIVLEELFKNKEVVIAVGGTGLYINALLQGLDDIPDINIEKDVWVELQYEKHGITWLREYVLEHDLPFSKIVDMDNPRRLLRAAKVIAATGGKFSDFLKGEKKIRDFKSLNFYLNPERTTLYNNINQRVESMIEDGLVEEVRGLLPDRHLKALQTVGYSELFDYLEHKISLEEAIDKIKQNTRRYAKRQFTWFKNQGSWIALDPSEGDKNLEIINSRLHDLEN